MKRLLTLIMLLVTTIFGFSLRAQTNTITSVLDNLRCKRLEMFYVILPRYDLKILDFSEQRVSYELLRDIINRDVFSAFDLKKTYDTSAKRNAYAQTKDYQHYLKGLEELRDNIMKQCFVFTPAFYLEYNLRDNQISFSIVEPNPLYLKLDTNADVCLKNKGQEGGRRHNVFTSPTLSSSVVSRLKANREAKAYMTVRIKGIDKEIIIAPQKLYLVNTDGTIIYEYAFQQSASDACAQSADNTIYDDLASDEQPQYPGGNMALMQFIAKNLNYPVQAMERGVQGRVVIEFVVEKDGSVSDAKVLRSVDTDLDDEALRIAKKLPKFTPGQKSGQPVRAHYTLPITFRIN